MALALPPPSSPWPDADEHGHSRAAAAARLCGWTAIAAAGGGPLASLVGYVIEDRGHIGAALTCVGPTSVIEALFLAWGGSIVLRSTATSPRMTLRGMGAVMGSGILLGVLPAAVGFFLAADEMRSSPSEREIAAMAFGLAGLWAAPAAAAVTLFVRVLHLRRFEDAWKHAPRT